MHVLSFCNFLAKWEILETLKQEYLHLKSETNCCELRYPPFSRPVVRPTYSPDFNPVKFVFNKMRSVMHYELWELTNEDIELAAVVFRYTSYIDV